MKFIYPAVYKKKEDGGFLAWMPDLEQCQAEGDNLQDTLDSLKDAEYNWLSVEIEEGGTIPGATLIEELALAPGEKAQYLAVNIRFNTGYDE